MSKNTSTSGITLFFNAPEYDPNNKHIKNKDEETCDDLFSLAVAVNFILFKKHP